MPLHLSGPTPVRIHEDLGEEFYDKVSPAQFPQHVIRYRNDAAAQSIGLGGLSDAAWIAHFGRFEPITGSFPHPLALRYHGHQFGHYNPELGDGRGFICTISSTINRNTPAAQIARSWHQGKWADALFKNSRWQAYAKGRRA